MTHNSNAVPIVFDPRYRAAKIARALRREQRDADFLLRSVLDDLTDRISVVNREFKNARVLLPLSPIIEKSLLDCPNVGSISQFDRSGAHAECPENGADPSNLHDQLADLIVSPLSLHWENDIPGYLARAVQNLKPDGLFLGVLPGDRTLIEFRECLLEAEEQLSGRAALRVDPFIEVRQAGSLLQRAGFALPVCDTEEVTVRFKDLRGLIGDLRSMGVTSSLQSVVKPLPRKVFERTEDIYKERFRDRDGKLRITFSFVHMSGWRKDKSQQKPLKPGSAAHKLADFLGN